MSSKHVLLFLGVFALIGIAVVSYFLFFVRPLVVQAIGELKDLSNSKNKAMIKLKCSTLTKWTKRYTLVGFAIATSLYISQLLSNAELAQIILISYFIPILALIGFIRMLSK
jgi:hypothetical protein